jgi:hypothetical protein
LEVIGIMSEITTAEDAVRKADLFITKYYPFHKLEGVRRVVNRWIVQYDVAVLGPKRIVTIKLDKETGGVIEYTSTE